MDYSVVIIEDQRMFRELLRTLIDDTPGLRTVGEAANPEEGWLLCQELNPDVAVIDLDLAGSSGYALAMRLKKERKKIAMLAVTSLVDPVTTTKVYESGFHGYVEKDQSPDVVIEAILTVAEGAHYFTQLVRENRKRIFTDPDAIHKILSPREQEIVGWVCRRKTSRAIAENMNLSVRTVENHRYRIMKKLSIETANDLVEFGRKLGFDRLVEMQAREPQSPG